MHKTLEVNDEGSLEQLKAMGMPVCDSKWGSRLGGLGDGTYPLRPARW